MHYPLLRLQHSSLAIRNLRSARDKLCKAMSVCFLHDTAEAWKQGYRLVSFLAWYSFLHHWDGLNEALVKRQWRLISFPAGTFASVWWGPVIKPVKHLFHLTVHPQVWCMTCELHECLPRTIRYVKSKSSVTLQTIEQTYLQVVTQ